MILTLFEALFFVEGDLVRKFGDWSVTEKLRKERHVYSLWFVRFPSSVRSDMIFARRTQVALTIFIFMPLRRSLPA